MVITILKRNVAVQLINKSSPPVLDEEETTKKKKEERNYIGVKENTFLL